MKLAVIPLLLFVSGAIAGPLPQPEEAQILEERKIPKLPMPNLNPVSNIGVSFLPVGDRRFDVKY